MKTLTRSTRKARSTQPAGEAVKTASGRGTKASGSPQTRGKTVVESGGAKGFRVTWTADDEKELRALAGSISVDQIAVKMQRTRKGIQRKAAKLNLSLAVKSATPANRASTPPAGGTSTVVAPNPGSTQRRAGWDTESLTILKERAGKAHIRNIAEELNRSVSSLQSKAQQLGLSLAYRGKYKKASGNVSASRKAAASRPAFTAPAPAPTPTAATPAPNGAYEPSAKSLAMLTALIGAERTRAGKSPNFEVDFASAQQFLTSVVAA